MWYRCSRCGCIECVCGGPNDLMTPRAPDAPEREERFEMRRDDTEVKAFKLRLEELEKKTTQGLDFLLDAINKQHRRTDMLERVLGRIKHVFSRETFFITTEGGKDHR